MTKLRRILARDWPLLVISLLLLAAGLVALSTPILLADYDDAGIQVVCGNGYHGRAPQVQVGDPGPGPQSSAAGAAATHYVEQCRAAVAHRRTWAIPAAVAGFAMLIPGLVKWARAEMPPPAHKRTDWAAAHPDQSMHQAALLDRQSRRHFEHPGDPAP